MAILVNSNEESLCKSLECQHSCVKTIRSFYKAAFDFQKLNDFLDKVSFMKLLLHRQEPSLTHSLTLVNLSELLETDKIKKDNFVM